MPVRRWAWLLHDAANLASLVKVHTYSLVSARPFQDFASDLETQALAEGRAFDHFRADPTDESEQREGWQEKAIEARKARRQPVVGRGPHLSGFGKTRPRPLRTGPERR
jgi:hypothetical protein